MPVTTQTAFGIKLTTEGKTRDQTGSAFKKNPMDLAREKAMSDMDSFIREKLKKDPHLPQLDRIQRSKVISQLRSSNRL